MKTFAGEGGYFANFCWEGRSLEPIWLTDFCCCGRSLEPAEY